MQTVIDIDDNLYTRLFDNGEIDAVDMLKVYVAVRKGVVIPKGHGRLIDADDIKVIELEDSLHIIRHCKGDDVDVYIDAPTIIEADKESEDKE